MKILVEKALAEPDIEEMTLTQIAASHEQTEQEPVAIKQLPDPYDERDGVWFDAEGLQRLRELPVGTKLYAAPVTITTPDVCGEVCARAKLCYGCNKDLEEANAKFDEQAEQEPVALSELRRIAAEYIEPNSQVDSGNLFWALCGALQYIDVELKFNEPTPHVQQEPLMDYERINALREGEQNGAEDAYFFVRPENDTPTLRKMFCQGFERGFHKGLKYASHVRTKNLTDDELDVFFNMYWQGKDDADVDLIEVFRAVIAADREKNK